MKILHTHVGFLSRAFFKIYETENGRYFMQDENEELTEIALVEFNAYTNKARKSKN